jgi:hypothetical protein
MNMKVPGCCFLSLIFVIFTSTSEAAINFKESTLVKDSSLTLGIHNNLKYVSEGETGKRIVHEAWGQGFSLDYKSGYLNDLIGIDGSYYGVIKLAASDNFSSRGIHYNDKGEARGFNKFGQFYGKVKFSDSNIDSNLYAGWKLMKLGVLTTSMRAAPNTYQGVSGDLSWNAYRMRVAYVDKSSNRDSPDKVHFTTNEGKEITSIYTGDLQFKSDELSLLYLYGESQNYLMRNGLELTLTQDEKLSYGVQMYTTNALNRYRSMSTNKKDFDSTANHYAIDMTWKHGSWTVKPALAYTQAHKTDGIGQFPRHMTKNSRGTFNSMAYAGLDYMRDKEKVFSFDLGYQLTPDFLVGINTHYGWLSHKGEKVSEGEFNIYTLWKPSSPALKNLSISTLVGPGRTFQHTGTTPITNSNGVIKKSSLMAYEFRIDYKFNIF